MNREKVKSGKYATVNRARRRARKARLNIVKLVWLTAVALVACAPVMAGDDVRAWVTAATADTRYEVELVAAERGWWCSEGGPIVAGGDLSGYGCRGFNGKSGTMELLSMQKYIELTDDWEFGDDRSGRAIDAQIRIEDVTVIVDGDNAQVCADDGKGTYCLPLSTTARTAIMDAAADISVEMRAQFDALKASK
jgi:hypothetical protein